MINIEVEGDDYDKYCEECGTDIDSALDGFVFRKFAGVTRTFCSIECADAFEESYYPPDPEFDDICHFRDPGGRSALRAGARIYPCPNCKEPNLLTAADVSLGYQCDYCAALLEMGYP
jgi:hypothetical protein